MLVPLNNYVARHNVFASGFGNRMYLTVGGNEMSGSYRKLALSVWHLKGAPDTDGNALQVSTRLRFRVNVFDARRDRLPARHTNGGWWVWTSRVQQAD